MPASAPAPAASSARRVLLVDDDQRVVTSVVHALADLGAEVTVANSGDEALAWLSRAQFRVLLTDHRMPRMTGEELIRQAGPQLALAETIVYVMSGWYDVAGGNGMHRIGGTQVRLVPKPISYADLERIVAHTR